MSKIKARSEIILFLTWIISLIATSGSLFFSEVMDYEPCKLCWFQRIFMYPLFIFTTLALIKKESIPKIYILVMSGVGMLISGYHYLIQKAPFFRESNAFCGKTPCNAEYINMFGFITIPFLALIAFTTILILNVGLNNKAKVKSK